MLQNSTTITSHVLFCQESRHHHTPLVKLPWISAQYQCDIFGKLELSNPTGSHKDRESRAIIASALKSGARKVGCASTGNLAISLAAHALAYGLECHIWLSSNIAKHRYDLVQMFGPVVHKVNGTYLDAINESNDVMKQLDIYNANPGACQAKFTGNACIGNEITSCLSPDFIICPTNNGSLLQGVWLGTRESLPDVKMVAATAARTSIASSIHGLSSLDHPHEVITASSGKIIAVSDDEIIAATRALFREGIIAEPASAASIAALAALPDKAGMTICCIISGNGLKAPVDSLYRSPRTVNVPTRPIQTTA